MGVTLDQHLSWNTQNICNKITSGISALRRLKEFIEFIEKNLIICCEVWDVFGQTQSKRPQKLQNRAARIIMNMSNDVHDSVVLQALAGKTLEIERKRAKAKMMYKLLNNMGPQSLTNLFTYKDEVTSYNLRNISSSLCLPHLHTNQGRR